MDGGWRVDQAREWLREFGGRNTEVNWGSIVAASIAVGDVAFTAPAGFPHVYLGLNCGSRSYQPIFREILDGRRSFLRPVEGKGVVAQFPQQGQMGVTTNMRRHGMSY